MPITLLATLAAGVLVHDWLRTKPSVQDAAPTRTGSIATANPDARLLRHEGAVGRLPEGAGGAPPVQTGAASPAPAPAPTQTAAAQPQEFIAESASAPAE